MKLTIPSAFKEILANRGRTAFCHFLHALRDVTLLLYMMTKKVVWGCVFVALTIPFIFQTTFYPLFRFGMFAEPVRYDIQEERFILVKVSSSGRAVPYVPENIGIGKNKLDYLLRNYYYRGETRQMLEQLKAILPDSTLAGAIQVFRIVGQDTTLVGEISTP